MRTMSVEKRLFAGKGALSDEKVCFLIESAFFWAQQYWGD